MQHVMWERARLARDARFDGKFFIAVRTTGIYCRPICPAPTCKASNVRYYATAAAATEAGFRPCLRCRPEAAPGTPAWRGTPATVARALKLIDQSALDQGSVEQLSDRLGIGSRHLRRLFLKHLGATPVVVAQTRRVHFAKRLIDDTALPMTEIAFAAGFGSLRRFNATFRNLYGRSPIELRKARTTTATEPGHYRFELSYRPPYDWASIVTFLGDRAIPGIETVTPQVYSRGIEVETIAGRISVRPLEHKAALELQVWFPKPEYLFTIVEKVRSLFDLGADPVEIAAHLGRDEFLSAIVKKYPGLRVPGCWDDFELAVRAVLGQQVSVKAATTLAGRMAERFGVFRQESLASAKLEELGVTSARAETIRSLARSLPDAWDNLTAIKGIGPWTEQYIAMRRGDPDAFPAKDLYLKPHAERADDWRPWRAYAAMYIWKLSGEKQ